MSGEIDAGTIRSQTLRSIRAGLVGTIIPDLSPGDPTTVGHLVLRLIDHLLAVEAEEDEGTDTAAVERNAVARVTDYSPASRAAMRDFVEAETARLVRRDPETAGGVAQMYLGGRTSRADDHDEDAQPEGPTLTADSLTAYLRQRFPEKQGLIVRSLDLLPGGMSKQTIKVRMEAGGREERFVIRKDFPVSPSEASVVQEYPMLCAMWQTGGVPMAEPLWAEPDPAIFGTPLMAVSLAEGSNDYSAAYNDPAVAHVFADALAGAMARLHAVRLQQTTAGPLVERSAREHVAAEIERWHSGLRRWKVAPDPVLEAAFAWLSANIPDQVAPSAIVHGDIGFHNMLMTDGRLSALLDWEFSHIGDPAEDVVYSRFFVEQVVDWRTFVDMYVRHGGTAPTPEQERFYAIWQSARNAAGCVGAQRAFLTKAGADMKLGVSGMTFGPRFALDALQRIVVDASK